ncbi:MAG: DUF2911 domain-containing protein [Bacteroidota bacterium]
MKKITNITLAIMLLIAFIPSISNAQLKLPQASPKAFINQSVGMSDISIDYHRPSVKGRAIWGSLVPYDSVWRTGANEASVISFSDDVKIEGKDLKAGKYAFFTIPGKSEWTLIFNKKKDLWGAYGYDKADDILRIKVKAASFNMNESMEFFFSDVTVNSVVVNLVWEKVRVSFNVTIDTDGKAMTAIKDSLTASPEKASLYRQAASYTVTSGLHLDKGLEWANKAISLKTDFRGYWTKAQVLAKFGNYNEAVIAATKAEELGKDDKDFAEMKPNVDKSIAEYKTKAGAKK